MDKNNQVEMQACPYDFENRRFNWVIGMVSSLWTLCTQPSLDFAFNAHRHHPIGRKHFHQNGVLFHGTLRRGRGKTTQTHQVIVRLSNATPVGLTPSIAIKIMSGSDTAQAQDLLLLSDVPLTKRETFFSTGFSSMVLNDVYYNHNRFDRMAKWFERIDPVNHILAKTNPHTRALSVSHVFDDAFAVYVYPTAYPSIVDLSDFDPSRRYAMKLAVYGITLGPERKQVITKVGAIRIHRQKPTIDDGTIPLYFRHHALAQQHEAPYAHFMSSGRLGTRYWGGLIKSCFAEDVGFHTRAQSETQECIDYNQFVLQTTTDIHTRFRTIGGRTRPNL